MTKKLDQRIQLVASASFGRDVDELAAGRNWICPADRRRSGGWSITG